MLTFLLCIPAGICFSQQKTIDSLEKLLASPAADTVTVMRYARLANIYTFLNNDSLADAYAERAMDLSNKIAWEKGQGLAKYSRVNFINPIRSLSLLFDCLKIFEHVKDTIGLIECSSMCNLIYKSLEDYHKSVEYGKKCLAYARSLNDTVWVWNALYITGNAYAFLEEKDSTLYYYQEAFRYANFMRSTVQGHLLGPYLYSKNEILGWSLHGMGQAQQLLGQHDLTLNYYHKGLVYASLQQSQILKSDLNQAISDAWLKMEKKDSAIKYAEITLNESLPLRYDLNILRSYSNLARSYVGVNNDSAVKYFQLAADMRRLQFSNKNKTEIANLTFNEQQRENDLRTLQLNYSEERKKNIQLTVLGASLIIFIIVFLLLSQSVIVKSGLVKFLGVVVLLLVFEFINLFSHPYIVHFTDHSTLWTFIIMVCIAAMLVPVHRRLEEWVTHQLVEKNKRIRLAAAKKTIAALEDAG